MAEEKKKKKSEAGKGDIPRPMFISQEEFASRWEYAFGKKKSRRKRIKKNRHNKISS